MPDGRQGRVYLVGPISGANVEDITQWRKDVAVRLELNGFKTYSPTVGVIFSNPNGKMDSSFDGALHPGKHAVYVRDKYYCRQADIILANFSGAQKVSIGSVVELAWADAWGKYVVVVMEDDNLHAHHFLQEIAGFTTPSLKDAVSHIIDMFGVHCASRAQTIYSRTD